VNSPANHHHPAGGLWVGHALATLAAIIWGLNFSLVKIARTELSAIDTTAWRFWTACVVVGGIWLWRRPNWAAWSLRSWLIILVMSTVIGPLFLVLLVESAVGVSAGLLGLIMATQSVHAAWGGRVLLGERLDVLQLVAVAVALTAVAIPIAVGGDLNYTLWWAPWVVAGLSVLGTANILVPKMLAQEVHAIDLATTILMLAGIACLPMMVIWGDFGSLATASWRGWVSVVLMGSIGHVGVFMIWFTALRYLSSVTAGLYLFVMMLAASVWGFVLVDEPPHWAQGLAMFGVMAALWLNAKGLARCRAENRVPAAGVGEVA